ncbi:MAG: hypothetical protein ACRC57_10595 [Sarcina sp.]
MDRDEILEKKLNKLKDELLTYLYNEYFPKITKANVEQLNNMFRMWKQDERIIEDLLLVFSMESNFSILNMDNKKIDKEITRVLFGEYIDVFLKNIDFDEYNISYKTPKKDISDDILKSLFREYFLENIEMLVDTNIDSFNDFKIIIAKENNKLKIDFKTKKSIFNIIK